MSNGAILVLAGPSGAGKSTIINSAADEIGEFYFSVSTTTRAPREGEIDGVHYNFVSKEEFEQDIKEGNFLEFATVHGNYYGTSLKPVIKALNEGKLVIFDIDVQGHRLVRDAMGDVVVSAFITPPTLKELETRLKNRCSDSLEVIEQRLINAKEEIQAISEFDFVIINDDIKKATQEFISIAKAARNKIGLQKRKELIRKWLEE